MTRTKYSFDDHPEHRAQLQPWAERWIANALNTKPMDDADRDAMRAAIDGMYDAAKLPRPRNIVFAASPIGGAIAAGIAAGVWYLAKNPQQHLPMFGRQISHAEIDAARDAAVRYSVDAALAVQRGDKVEPLAPATRAATSDAPDDATAAATRNSDLRVVAWLVGLTSRWWNMCDAGNFGSAWVSFLSFFRHVAKLEIDYSAWDHYEQAAVNGSYRFMHPDFCIVADRPTTIGRDAQNRAHCIDGPQIAWRDGFASYSIHGVRVDAKIIERRFTVADIDAQPNAEVRRVMIDLYGRDRFMIDGGALVLDEDRDELGNRRQLLIREVSDDEPIVALRVVNSTPEPDGTSKEYQMRVHPELRPIVRREPVEYGKPQQMTCANAAAWLAQVSASRFELEFQT